MIKLFFVTKTKAIYSFFLFLEVDLNEEKRVYMQDDEIKSCCVQNQNKYIYRLSTAVNHMRFE